MLFVLEDSYVCIINYVGTMDKYVRYGSARVYVAYRDSSPCPSSRIKVVRKYFDFVEI